MADLIPINIIIGDRSYRIKTTPEDEESIRATLKIINEKIVDFRSSFAGKDMQDYIAMVLIWFATQTPTELKAAPDKEIIAALGKLEEMLGR